MFGELLKDIKDAVSTAKHGTATETLTFAKPYCTPARGIIEPVLAKYGVKVYGYEEAPRRANPREALKMSRKIPGDSGAIMPQALPIAQVAKVTVSSDAAAWAEYLLLRTQQLHRVGGYVNRRNEQWAAKHGGQMPPAWNEGKPWIESSCSSGIQAWQEVKEASRKQQQKGKGRK